MLTGYVAIDGKITTADKAKISVFDRGYLYGDALMEVMYACKGKVVAAPLHLKRLYTAANRLRIDLPWPQSLLLNELHQLARYYESCYLRLTVSSGLGAGVARPSGEPQRTMICMPYMRQECLAPLSLKSQRRRANFANDIKTTNYLESIVALEALERFAVAGSSQEEQDILWLTADDLIAETTAANIFFVKTEAAHNAGSNAGNDTDSAIDTDKWEFYTPANTGELLAGMTRYRICQYLKGQGLAVYVIPIAYQDLPKFNSAFICSSLQGVRLLNKIDSYAFATKTMHSFCQSLNQHLAFEATNFH